MTKQFSYKFEEFFLLLNNNKGHTTLLTNMVYYYNANISPLFHAEKLKIQLNGIAHSLYRYNITVQILPLLCISNLWVTHFVF